MGKRRAEEPVRPLVAFDWALKRLLRSKANFDVLEGFLTELLGVEVGILELLESESNQEHRDDKQNRVDLKVKLASGEVVIIEVQASRHCHFLERMLYGTSRVVTELMEKGFPYAKVLKVVSVNLVYFPVVGGQDYVYRGATTFKGLHRGDELGTGSWDPFPTYWVLQIDRFDDVARNTLDEWIYMLKNQDVPPGFTARGLAKAKQGLSVLSLTPELRQAYERDKDDSHYQASMDQTEFLFGVEEGLRSVARRLRDTHDDEAVAALTGLPVDEVAKLRAASR